jgi:hypothetical protein
VIQLWIITILFRRHCPVVCHLLGIFTQNHLKPTRLGELSIAIFLSTLFKKEIFCLSFSVYVCYINPQYFIHILPFFSPFSFNLIFTKGFSPFSVMLEWERERERENSITGVFIRLRLASYLSHSLSILFTL